MELTIEESALLMFLGAGVVGMVLRQLSFPYNAGLLLFAVAPALLSWPVELSLTREVLSTVVYPPLVFGTALSLS